MELKDNKFILVTILVQFTGEKRNVIIEVIIFEYVRVIETEDTKKIK